MEVIITSGPEESAALAADAIVGHVKAKPNAVIGVATGSSPMGTYAELGRRVAAGAVTFAQASAVMLDEYVGLPANHPEAYRTVVEEIFVKAIDIDTANVHGPDGNASDISAACAAYEQLIKDAGGVDVQLLGIGTDGHIGFNEPSSSLASRTRIKTLTQQTRIDNARFFDDDLDQVPTHCVTQGIGTILEARHLVLVASGRGKAEAIRQAVEGPVSALWPASALQLHPRVTVIVDQPAGSRLALADYYRDVYANKPDWQRF